MRLGLFVRFMFRPHSSESQGGRRNEGSETPAKPLPPKPLHAPPAFDPPRLRPAHRRAGARPAGDADWLYRGSDIARDPAWRFGTLPNGLRYAVRRNALPAGQVSIRIRIDAGSLHEQDNERGWAHFVEHHAVPRHRFHPDRRAREVWQELGASFGSDSNASTSATETVYQLNLPHAERGPLDTSLRRARRDDVARPLRDRGGRGGAAGGARREGRRPELAQRVLDLSRPCSTPGCCTAIATRSAPTKP